MDIYLYSIYSNKKKIKEGFNVSDLTGVQHSMAPFLVSIFAVYLCFQRNVKLNQPKYLIYFYCLIAFIFSGIYIFYYFISSFFYLSMNDFNYLP
jgi:hypothetical protein